MPVVTGIQVGRGRCGVQHAELTVRVQGAQAGLTDCAPTPFKWAPQSLGCLTACLAPPGIDGGVHRPQKQADWNTEV